MSGKFDVFESLNPDRIGEMTERWGDTPIITFHGGDVYEGWIHERFFLTEKGLRFEAWESGGYQESYNEGERPASVEELKARIRSGDIPLARWSNRKGLEFVNKVMNEITEEEILKRIRQVRDALNKCRDIERIEAAARVFGL